MKTQKIKRIYHTWDKWECHKAGFFEDGHNTLSKEECEQLYASFFKNEAAFAVGMELVLANWKYSCEHNLTNESMNRIAWLGQASMCIVHGVPSCYRAGYNLLTPDERIKADGLALVYLNKWLASQGYPATDGKRSHKTSNIY